MLMGSFLGYFVGILPAAGATPGSLMAYGFAKTMAKDPGTFGKGNIDGVVAPEAANNAASTGALLPMLTLGIPGSPTTAILLGGMVIWGLEPGPLLFIEHKDFVWGLIASLYVANLFALLINIAFIPVFIWVLKMPFTILAPIIFVLCVVGGYAPTQDLPRRLADDAVRHRRLPHAQAGLSYGPGGSRHRARPARRAGAQAVAAHFQRLVLDLRRAADVGGDHGRGHRDVRPAADQDVQESPRRAQVARSVVTDFQAPARLERFQ